VYTILCSLNKNLVLEKFFHIQVAFKHHLKMRETITRAKHISFKPSQFQTSLQMSIVRKERQKPAVFHISFRWSVDKDDQVGDQQSAWGLSVCMSQQHASNALDVMSPGSMTSSSLAIAS